GKTIDRKLTEAFLANRIEQHYSKNDILELYLNRIFFGSGFYGIEAAAQGYFGKSARQLTIDESAVLVGLIKSPNRLSPINNPKLAKQERNYVLNRMRDEKKLTREECIRLKEMELKISPKPVKQLATYEEAYIRQLVIDQVGYEEASQGGYRVYTTIDRDIQHVARESLKAKLTQVENETPGYVHPKYADYDAAYRAAEGDAEIKALGKPEYLQGAVMMIDNDSGAIIAMVGGRDFKHSEYNRALQSKRPAGTAFMPFVYAAAFGDGEKFPGSIVSDSPMDQRQLQIGGDLVGVAPEWGVEQEENSYEGDISARRALVKGKVAASVRLGNGVGLTKVTDLAARAGIESKLKAFPSTFVGASEVKMAEMCLGYSMFPNKGKRPPDV
ncbi:MAG: transglycosylase domain-containing protein, partial [Verrucomicrobiales bacterium]|nr:transglycosylase domain-containing protein [Verrucomicrobiales bacterium]